MNDHDDRLLDDLLRDVPIPPGIATRVLPAVLFDDAALDRLLLEVDHPAGLEDRVRRAVAAAAHPVAMAPGDAPRAGGPAAGRAGWSGGRILRWMVSGELLADSAAVAAALSIVAAMFFVGTEVSRRLAAPAVVSRQVAFDDAGKRPAAAAWPRPTAPAVRTARPLREAAPADVAAAGDDRGMAPGERPQLPAGNKTMVGGGAVSAAVDRRAVARPVEVRAAPEFAPLTDAARDGAGGIRTVLLPAAGRRLPRVPGFDIAFEMAHGESPFVDPAASPSLATDHPPLALRTDSFDMLHDAVRRDGGRGTGRRTRRGGPPVVQAEEVLAALPSTADAGGWQGPGIGLSIQAVRSFRPQPASLLVEICATAPPLDGAAAVTDEPLHAMLLLDPSGGPFATRSWQWLCRGLARVVRQMRPADRLSLVVCGERPRLVALRADAAHLADLLPELVREPLAKAADFDAAFRLAAAVGRREGRPDRIVAVAHAGSLEQCRDEGRAAVAAWQAERAGGAASAVGFVVVDPQPPLGGDADAVAHGSATGSVAADQLAIGRAMLAGAFGRPTLVATGCRLEVAFDPARVAAYRIVGHRQTAAEALAADKPRPIDLHVGETVRVVYEIVRRSGGPLPADAGLVSATLGWTPADAGRPASTDGQRQARAVLTANAVAEPVPGRVTTHDPAAGLPSGQKCELLLAVAVGELLGGSVHAEPWRQAASGITSLVARWRARGDVTPHGRLLIECLEYHGLAFEPVGR